MKVSEFSKKNILIISPERWDCVKVSKHHYAMELVKRGHNVYFLNPPDPTLYRQLSIISSGIENLYIVNYPGQLKGIRFLPAYLQRKLNRIFLKQLETVALFKMDVIWNFENSRFYDLSFTDKKVLKIYHQVDDNQNFHVSEAAISADICFCVTEFLLNKLSKYNAKTFKIPHGFQMYSGIQQCKEFIMDSEKDHIHAAYVGNLDMVYLDLVLLENLVKSFPQVSFCFIGNFSEEKLFYKTLIKYKNCLLPGKIPSECIIEYLKMFDILLLIYKAGEFREQVANSHKLLEYFASGKITVATYTDEYKDKRHLLAMTDSSEEYIAKFSEVLKNLNFYNSPEKQAERIAFAKDNSYSRQLERINELLIKNQLPGI